MTARGATGHADRDAAYFALLRAREELTALQRYGEWLEDEGRRVRRQRQENAAADDAVSRRLRRPLATVDRQLADVLAARERVVEQERASLEERLAEAASYVEDCEADLAAFTS